MRDVFVMSYMLCVCKVMRDVFVMSYMLCV